MYNNILHFVIRFVNTSPHKTSIQNKEFSLAALTNHCNKKEDIYHM